MHEPVTVTADSSMWVFTSASTRIFFCLIFELHACWSKAFIYDRIWYNLGCLSCLVKQAESRINAAHAILQICRTRALPPIVLARTWWFSSYRRTVWAWFSLPLCNVSSAVRICAVRLRLEVGECETDLVVQASAKAPYCHLNITEGWWWQCSQNYCGFRLICCHSLPPPPFF